MEGRLGGGRQRAVHLQWGMGTPVSVFLPFLQKAPPNCGELFALRKINTERNSGPRRVCIAGRLLIGGRLAGLEVGCRFWVPSVGLAKRWDVSCLSPVPL